LGKGTEQARPYITWKQAPPHPNGDLSQPIALLCARGERPCRRSAEKGDQLAPFQLIELHALLLAKGHRITD
jgi:hypothetical protein